MSDWIEFRNAQREDTPLILAFIRELADYEHMLDEVVADEVLLENWIFDKEKAEVLFVLEDGKEVGFALFFHNFSTFLGRGGIYLEDLLCPSGGQRKRIWKGAAEETCLHCSGAGLRSSGMVVPGLE